MADHSRLYQARGGLSISAPSSSQKLVHPDLASLLPNTHCQANNIYTYRIDVERFVYSSEKIDTGVAAIDAIEDARSIDALTYELIEENGIMLENGDPLTLENGNRLRNESSGALILENGFKIIKEDYGLSTTTTTATTAASAEPLARNADFGLNAEDIIDFSTTNPFGEVQR